MTKEEILLVERAFADASERIKKSGFDGVEIHAAHTYLINQFLSPYYNRRDDEYGGSLENRMRFLEEICLLVRQKVGNDFAIAVKLTASEFFDGGLTFDEIRKIAVRLEQLGIDVLELSGNIHGKAKSMAGETFDGYQLRGNGYFLEYATELRKDIKIPIITVGGFRDIDTVEYALNECGMNAVGIARPLLAEPQLLKRWKAGDSSPAICVSCSKCRTAQGNYCTVFRKKDSNMDEINYDELICAFHMTWDSFPGAARLIDKKNLTIAVNQFAREHGLEEGQICAKIGAPESHRGCLKTAALKEMTAKIDRPAEGKIRGWLPLADYPDVVVHFSVGLPDVNE